VKCIKIQATKSRLETELFNSS